jgi:hypothetical protein
MCGMIPLDETASAQRSRSGRLFMDQDIPLPFDLPAVARKKVSAAFDGGRITSDGGVMLLAQAELRLGIADQLARVIPDERDPDRVIHVLPGLVTATIDEPRGARANQVSCCCDCILPLRRRFGSEGPQR